MGEHRVPGGGGSSPGPGGSTKRQRQKKFLFDWLQALFSRLGHLDQEEQEEPWQTQSRRRPKGGNSAAVAKPQRTVRLDEARPTGAETSVLHQLQQLIADCQSHGAQGIIGKLRGILNGSRSHESLAPVSTVQSPASRLGQGKGKGKGDKYFPAAPRPPANVGGTPAKGGGKANTPRLASSGSLPVHIA